ncbi:MAG: hypothetical protein H6744_20440 [Deltaproteobacteria bacterium]|nr:hypothetical protein [Deltaproteobacteria bacterium]MCB9789052.1 hypothetical protein [Deltaproteobacteria bacterium]
MAKGDKEQREGFRPGELDPRSVRDAVATDLRVIQRFKAEPPERGELPPPNTHFETVQMGRPAPPEAPPRPPMAPNAAFELKVWHPKAAATPPQGIGSRRPPGT